MRKCKICSEEKDITEYTSFMYPNRRSPNGVTYHHRACKPCRAKQEASIRRKDVYGVSDEWYEKQLEMQGSECMICGGETCRNKPLFIDHNHDTGAVRGLLCGPCNSMIGFAQENPSILNAGIDYLGDYNV